MQGVFKNARSLQPVSVCSSQDFGISASARVIVRSRRCSTIPNWDRITLMPAQDKPLLIGSLGYPVGRESQG